MEFELEGSEACVEGDVEMILPDHMTMLCSDELERVKTSTDITQRVIAAGRHPKTNEVIMVVATGRVFSTNRFNLDVGKVFPINDGNTVVIGGRVISSKEALDGAQVLYVNSGDRR